MLQSKPDFQPVRQASLGQLKFVWLAARVLGHRPSFLNFCSTRSCEDRIPGSSHSSTVKTNRVSATFRAVMVGSRRAQTPERPENKPIQIGDICLEPVRRVVTLVGPASAPYT